MSDDLCFTPATELAAMLRHRAVSAAELVEAFLDRIERRNPAVNAYVTLLSDDARERARDADRRLASGEPVGPLHGLPVCLKDLYEDKAGVPTTIGAPRFAHYVPEASSTYVERLERAGAIVIGKTNVPEFGTDAAAACADNRTFGATISPLAPGRSAGGSSGGSAAAVVDGLAALAQGSDGGGSLRIPASLCGAYAIKPTFGRVANAVRPNGFAEMIPATCYGPIARTVGDAALMLETMIGPHPRDPVSIPDDGFRPTRAVGAGIGGLRIAYRVDFGGFPVDERVVSVVDEAVEALRDAGGIVTPIDFRLPHGHAALSDVWLLEEGVTNAVMVENRRAAGLDLLGDHGEELAPEFRAWVERGRAASALEYVLANVKRTDVFDAVEDVFEQHDLLVTATLATPPFEVGPTPGSTRAPRSVAGVAVEPAIGWCLTFPLNLTGHPAASVPAGMTDAGPVGMQIIGRRFDDATVLAASAALERQRPWAHHYERLKTA